MTLPELLIIACWVAFLFFWEMTARSAKQDAEKVSFTAMAAYLVPLWAGAVLIFKGFSHTPYFWDLDAVVIPGTRLFDWLGFAIALGGLFLAIWSRRSLGRNWSAGVVIKQDHELVTAGPYAAVRHPIYTAFLLLFIGSAVALGTLATVVGVALVFISCWIKLAQEEKLMIRQFPYAYSSYMSRTKKLVPYIW